MPKTSKALQPAADWKRPLLVAVATTALVTGLSYALPSAYAATGVGLAFLAVTYVLVLRGDDVERVRHFGLSLAGLMEPEPLDARRIARDFARALMGALVCAAVLFPLFWAGYVWWWKPVQGFHPAHAPSFQNDVLGELLVIALPEEAFYRGYLQTAFDDVWRPRFRLLGAEVGPGLLVASAIFALGHLATEPNLNRLAVFFPALVFGWLRTRQKGIGSSVLLHMAANLFASYLAQSYGLVR